MKKNKYNFFFSNLLFWPFVVFLYTLFEFIIKLLIRNNPNKTVENLRHWLYILLISNLIVFVYSNELYKNVYQVIFKHIKDFFKNWGR